MRVPLLVVLSRRDVLVDNDAIRRHLIGRYRGPHELLEYDTDHYVDFTSAQPMLADELRQWMLCTVPRLRAERS